MTNEVLRPAKLSIWERFPQLKEIPPDSSPNHIVMVPDGNRRYGKSLGENPLKGHMKGAKVAKEILNDLVELPINFVTFWAFSSDNWKRPPEEVQGLMQLLVEMIHQNTPDLMEKNTKLIHIGRKDRISEKLRQTLEYTEELTKQNSGQRMCLAIDYGGKDEIIRIIEKARNIPKDIPITEEIIEKLRDGGNEVPQADLFIRTSEERTSGFGLLVGEKTEFYFIKNKLFPELETGDIVSAIIDFSKRQRRLGK